MQQLIKVTSSIAVFNQKVNNIHFNYTGIEFYNVHKMTEKLYEGMIELYDQYSEKIRMGGEKAPGTFEEHLKNSFINEEPSKIFELDEIIEILVQDLSLLISENEKIKSTATIQPMLDEFYLLADKWRWLFASMKR